jgi:hypothetical protein
MRLFERMNNLYTFSKDGILGQCFIPLCVDVLLHAICLEHDQVIWQWYHARAVFEFI